MRSRALRVALLLLALGLPAKAGEGLEVRVSRPFFNPSLGEKLEISVRAPQSGLLDALVIDRDGFLVRTLSPPATASNAFSLVWDGKTDAGEIVADEAYSLKLGLKAKEGAVSYFPANEPLGDVQVGQSSFDRQRGVITYRLPRPCRVLVTASGGKMPVGAPVPRKTIVDWGPRTAGSVVEQWNGYDEANRVNLIELPDSTIRIEARALPENALITVGNRNLTYRDWVSRRPGSSLISRAVD